MAINLTLANYEAIERAEYLDIKWAERSTPPSFTPDSTADTGGFLDEGTSATATASTTTLSRGGLVYTLQTAQICAPTHASFMITPTLNRDAYKAELTLYFEVLNDDATEEKGILIVIPLLETAAASDPAYLRRLTDPTVEGTVGLYNCLPTYNNGRWAYYSTCISNQGGSKVGNLMVFVGVQGTPVSPQTLAMILTLLGGDAGKGYPAFRKPTLLSQDTTSPTVLSDGATNDYRQYLSSGLLLVSPKGTSNYVPTRLDPVDAYKCVPFDPDKNIKDGKIEIDMNTGKPLTDALNDRKAESAFPFDISPGKVERILSIVIGIVLSILLFVGVFYFLILHVVGKFYAGWTIPPWIQQTPLFIVIAVLFSTIGFLMGALFS